MEKILLSYYDRNGAVHSFETEAFEVVIGSGHRCGLRIDGLRPEECRIYLSVDGYYAEDLGGRLAINSRVGSGFLQDGDGITLGARFVLRFSLQAERVAPQLRRETPRAAEAPVASTRRKGTGRSHSPGFALFAGIFLPGAGQAYNGQPIKGMILAVLSVLILPWLLSLWGARRTALRIVENGGRTGRGGLFWVVLHCWGLVNLGLLASLILTLSGVLV